MTLILIVALSILLVAAYVLSGKALCDPSVLYVAPFIAMSLVAFLFQWAWNLELHLNTFAVIFLGAAFFVAGSFFGSRIKLTKTGTNCAIDYGYGIENWKYVVLFIVSLFAFLWRYKLVVDYGYAHGAKTISRALVVYNNMLKFTTDELIQAPRIVSICTTTATVAGFIWACDFANQVVRKRKHKDKMILSGINLVLCIVGSVSNGARGGAVQIICAFAIALIIMLYRAGEWNRHIPVKYVFLLLFVFLLTAFGFLATVTLIGRYKVNAYGRYFANYLGAQLYNLNYYLNESFRSSEIFGQETFHSVIQYIAKLLGYTKYIRYTSDLPNVYIGTLNVGNVYTCYYSYIHDFGYWGVPMLSFVYGGISSICYRYARKSSAYHPINMGLIIYARLSYCLLFSYFSNKFYSIIISANFVKQLFYTAVVLAFLFRFHVRFYLGSRRLRIGAVETGGRLQ